MMEQRYYRGQIYYVYPQKVTGSEQEGGRPAVIVSNDVCNEFSGVVEVVFLTTREKPPLPTHVRINSTNRLSTALCEQIESVDKERLGRYINEVSEGEMKNLEKAMLVSLQIATNLKGSKVLETWRKMMETCDPELGGEESDGAKSFDEGNKVSEKGMKEIVMPMDAASSKDIRTEPEYIRIIAERDIYRNLYMELIKNLGVVCGERR